MATSRSFSNMLNDYLTNDLLREEVLKRDYILSTCQKDNSWKGGPLIVPFKATGASSVRMGKLTQVADISQDKFVRGEISDYKEAWGSMIFNHRDIMDHSGRVNEDSFLKILPDLVEDFADYMKMVVSIQLGTGPHFATLTVAGTAGGVITVDKIDRFCLDQKITLLGTGLAVAADYYVINININTNEVTLSATRGGAAADVSLYTVVLDSKVYTDDADAISFQSMRDAYLSAANGGSATLHGQTKTAYPFLQAVNIDGSSWTAANVLGKMFDGYTEVRKKARGRASDILCSYTVGGAIMQAIENGGGTNGYRGNYSVTVKDKKASLYGWDEVMLTTVKGDLKVVMIQEWDDDIVVYHDPKSCTFRSNGYFKDRINPDDGRRFYEVRTEDGFQYVVDKCLFGEMEHTKPGNNGIVHSIDPANF